MRRKETGSREFIWERPKLVNFRLFDSERLFGDGVQRSYNGVGRAPRPETPVRDIKTASRQDTKLIIYPLNDTRHAKKEDEAECATDSGA